MRGQINDMLQNASDYSSSNNNDLNDSPNKTGGGDSNIEEMKKQIKSQLNGMMDEQFSEESEEDEEYQEYYDEH